MSMQWRAPESAPSLAAFQKEVEHLCKNGLVSEALRSARLWHYEGLPVSASILHSVLQGCACKQCLALGLEAHCLMVRTGFQSSSFLSGALIRMLALCGALSHANRAFGQVKEPDVYLWTVIISANAQCEQHDKALQLYGRMQEACMAPDGHVVVAVLKSCIAAKVIMIGKLVHFQIIENGLEVDAFVGNILVDFYVKFGNFDDTWGVFGRLASRDPVTWSAMIGGHVEHAQHSRAIQLFFQMQQEGIEPDRIIIVSVLKACSSLAALPEGRLLHAHILRKNLEMELSVLNTTINMYAKCGQIEDAIALFDKLDNQDIVAWNVMISGCVHAGQDESAFYLYCEAIREGCAPSHVTYMSMLQACAGGGVPLEGMLIHGDVIESGLQGHVLVGNSLVDMYGKCNRLEDAAHTFSKLPTHNAATWNARIAGHAYQGHADEACGHLQRMLLLCVQPSSVTFINMLMAFSGPDSLYHGKLIHCYLVENLDICDMPIFNALINMYANSGSFELAFEVFNRMFKRDITTWNTIIEGCAKFDRDKKALELFEQMQRTGLEPDAITCNCMLKIRPSARALQHCRSIHNLIIVCGFISNNLIGNSLIDMYSKCGSLEEACNVFARDHKTDVVTFNVMIEGYIIHGFEEKACHLVKHMQHNGVLPDRATLGSAVCGTASLQQGKRLHVHVIESAYASELSVGNSLLNMYAKYGSLEHACKFFDRLSKRDAILWCSMIVHCAKHNNQKLALHYFKVMQEEGFEPTDRAILKLLSDNQVGKEAKELRFGLIDDV